MQTNFTVIDVRSTAAAFVVFPLFLVVPGYSLGWLLNLMSFRERSPLIRLLLSLPLSLSVTPVVVYLLARELGMWSAWGFYGILWAVFGALAIRETPLSIPKGVLRPLLYISGIWIVTAVFSLVDLQAGKKLFLPAEGYDYTIRSAAIGQLARSNWLPAANPFFFPGHPTLFRYHYFWFLISSFPARLLHGFIGPRHALIAGVIWVGFTLMATIAIYLRLFDGEDSARVRQRTLAAFGLLCISGLDIVPTLFAAVCRIGFHRNNIYPSVDWWNRDQVTGWIDSVLWVPHHVAGMIACMTGFLILWVAWRKEEGRFRWQPVAGAALAIASGVGLSVYVGFVFSVCLLVWAMVELAGKHFSRALGFAAAALGAALLIAPYGLDLARAGATGASGGGGTFVRLGVRMFEPTHALLRGLHFAGPAALQIGDLLSLPINFLFELGALFLIGIIQVRQWTGSDAPLSPAQRAGATLASVSLVVCLFIRSNTIETNDLGMRGMLIVQFMLVLWGADVILNWRAGKIIRLASVALGTTLAIGAVTNLYELFMLRSFAVLTDAGMKPGENLITPGEHFASRAFASREMYEWLETHSPASTVEQPNPFAGNDLIPGLYSNRQMSMTSAGMALAFGGDPQQVAMMTSRLREIFETKLSPSRVDSLCQQSGIDLLIATSADPVWNDTASWVWNREPVFANPMARAVACGSMGATLRAYVVRKQPGGDRGE